MEKIYSQFKDDRLGYDGIKKWIDFLIDLETRMLVLTGDKSMVESLSIFLRAKYNWMSKKSSSNKKKVVGASEIFESDDEITEKYNTHFFRGSASISEELAVEVIRDTERLATINRGISKLLTVISGLLVGGSYIANIADIANI